MKKFIITDPCYIMNERDYDKICSLYDLWKGAAKKIGIPVNSGQLDPFEAVLCPFKSTHKDTKKPIVFHLIKGTPNGDGGYTFNEQEIGVDAGMLCIAECSQGWKKETLGATFDSLSDARYHFRHILEKF